MIKNRWTVCTLPLLCAVACGEPSLDEGALRQLVDRHREWGHVVVTNVLELRQRTLAEIRANADKSHLAITFAPDFSLFVVKAGTNEQWRPAGFLRARRPARQTYPDLQRYLTACVDYHASTWILKHPDKQHFFCPAVAASRRSDGMWVAETGAAVLVGPGLLVVVTEQGELHEIREIFNPE